MSEVVKYEGRNTGFVAPLAQPAKFSEGVSSNHRPFYDDYNVAKAHIEQALGNLSDLDVFGRYVVVAVYCRPNMMTIKRSDGTTGAIYIPLKAVKEDWYQQKTVLVLKCGPDAFKGDSDGTWHNAQFGENIPAPRAGDWLIANASSGIQISLAGDGGQRPQGLDQRGEPMDIFEWDGWPCRIIGDDQFFGRLTKPHEII